MQETQVWSLGWEDPLEKEMATHSHILAWRIPWMGALVGYCPWGCKDAETTEWLTHTGALAAISRQGELETNILHLTSQRY